MLDDIEVLEDAAGGGWRNQSRIQTTLNKCYVFQAIINGLISNKEIHSRISNGVNIVSKYANGGRRFLEYHNLFQ